MTFIAAANFSSVDIAATPVGRNKKLPVVQGCVVKAYQRMNNMKNEH